MTWLHFNSWSISVHILIWSLLPAVVGALALAAGWSTYEQVQTTSALATDSRITLNAATELLQGVVDLETGVRGYALTADPAFLEPYEHGRPEVVAQLGRLRELVADRDEQHARVDRVAALVEDWNQAFAQSVIEGVRAGQDVRPFIQQGVGKRRIDLIRDEIGAFEAAESAALAKREARDAAAWRLAGFLSAGALLTLLLSSVAALLFGRRIAGAVGAFARAAGEIAGGSLETRLPEHGRNELTATGRAINRMAAALAEAREELLAQNEALFEQHRQLEAERARAAEVQADLLPHAAPDLPGVQLAGHCIPALQVGGDFFDWYASDGLVWLTLGDVMGKGMPAALLMATVRATLRAGTPNRSPAATLNLAQAVLGEDLGHRDSYVTLFHAVYEPATGRLAYVDAGHGHALIRRADGRVERLARRSFPLGMPFATDFAEGHAVLAPNDALILYSDGLVEAVPSVDAASIAHQLDGADSAQRMVASLIDVGVDSRLPAAVTLDDDLTVVVLRAVDERSVAPRHGDEEDGRVLVGPGVGSRGRW